MAATATPKSSGISQTFQLDTAVENLKDRVQSVYVDYSNDGDLNQLVSELGYIRDRADQIQTVALGVINALTGL